MPPAVAPIPPTALKDILVLHGYEVLDENEYNWIMAEKGQPKAVPFVIPKLGDLVAIDVMMDTLINAKLSLGTYFALKEKVLGKNWSN